MDVKSYHNGDSDDAVEVVVEEEGNEEKKEKHTASVQRYKRMTVLEV